MVLVMVVFVVAVAGLVVAGTLWVLPLEWWGANKDAVQTFVLPFGATGALVALALAGWRSWAQFQQTQTDRRRQVTQSFEGAVALLGHDNPSVRIGAIYALERIARQNRDEHWPIMETLTAYVREWSARRKLRAEAKASGEMAEEAQLSPTGDLETQPEPKRADADLQAVFTVLGRRRIDHEQGTGWVPRGVNLEGAHLAYSNTDAPRVFAGAILRNATLFRAVLWEANLEGADLSWADLRRARLEGANLARADLEAADLRWAWLRGAKNTNGANLIEAKLDHADLRGANLSTAKGVTQKQLNSASGDTGTKIPEGQGLTRPPRWGG